MKDPLRALSLSQPWAWCMTVPPPPDRKDVENRNRPCPPNMIGRRFAIHAAQSWDPHGAHMIHGLGLRFPPQATITRGAVVALATIDRQVTQVDGAASLPVEQRRWFFGPYGYVFRDLSVLTKPVPCRGMLGFWTVLIDTEREIMGQMVADARDYAKRCDYDDDRTTLIVAAVRRTGRHGSQLDDEAWLSVPTNAANRGQLTREWLAKAGAL